MKIGGGIGLGVILLIAIIVPCVMILPKTTTTEAVTTTQAISVEPSIAPTIALTDPPSTIPTILSTEALIDTTTEKPSFILDEDSEALCQAIPQYIDGGNLCGLINDVEMETCTSNDDG